MPGDEVPAHEDRKRMYVEAEEFLRILKDKKVAFVIGNTKHMINFLAKLRLKYQLLSTSEDRGIFLVSIE
jgi:myo-inositol-1-phosphate synthase